MFGENWKTIYALLSAVPGTAFRKLTSKLAKTYIHFDL